MQENRLFDLGFGTLQGVRDFNDSRGTTLPDKNLVWLQTNNAGKIYAPFRFDIKNAKAIWIGSVPHSRSTQVDANSYEKYDKCLPAKWVRDKKYIEMSLTPGHYTREDIPFTYAMADAFTVCDQHFCSVISSTDTNQLFFWTRTIRKEQNGHAPRTLKWETFPERLQNSTSRTEEFQSSERLLMASANQGSWLGFEFNTKSKLVIINDK